MVREEIVLAEGLKGVLERPGDHTDLRPMGSTVPSIYGPSADEPM
jgi:hypothetical protein